ncbi:MAG: two-component system response regulator [Deltaproteobacteria bacterium RIFCSPLOWO2_02_FULL_53_8]|nr:MAG: two-component system response regulator [Deltaproteobacteria bacterium RIFCSPLOWO2_02_FULL_53_8]
MQIKNKGVIPEKTILLVEDNADDMLLTIRAFKKNNLAEDVVFACDGGEALDYLHGFGEYAGRDLSIMPRLVLLDLSLPKVNGFEILRKIRATAVTQYLPVVILTSSMQEQDIYEAYRLGCNSYIRKPVNFELFIETVKQLGIYWLTLNETSLAGLLQA